MANAIKLIDKVHLQKYLYLISLFVSDQISASDLVAVFIQVRRDDQYWMSGRIDERISKVLDTFFLDIDEYAPDDLFDPADKFNIDGVELKKRSELVLERLNALVG